MSNRCSRSCTGVHSSCRWPISSFGDWYSATLILLPIWQPCNGLVIAAAGRRPFAIKDHSIVDGQGPNSSLKESCRATYLWPFLGACGALCRGAQGSTCGPLSTSARLNRYVTATVEWTDVEKRPDDLDNQSASENDVTESQAVRRVLLDPNLNHAADVTRRYSKFIPIPDRAHSTTTSKVCVSLPGRSTP
jgi:hypothetical protein